MTIFLVILGISILILVHELGHFLAAKFFNVKVEEFGFGFPPRLLSKKFGETKYSLNLLPLGGFVKLLGESPAAPVPEAEKHRSFSSQSAHKRLLIIVAGVLMNFFIGWLIVSFIFMVGAPSALLVTNVLQDTPAAITGLRSGDQLSDFKTADEFISFIDARKGEEVNLNIRRGEEILNVLVVPRVNVPEGEGALGVGIAETGFSKKSFFGSFLEGFKTSVQIVGAIFTGLLSLIVGVFTGARVFENLVGPVGIFGVATQAGQLGYIYLLQLIGLISLNLFVLNIFPFPALDGGRLLFILIEKIKGSPMAPRLEAAANGLGFAFLLALMLAITIKDIAALF